MNMFVRLAIVSMVLAWAAMAAARAASNGGTAAFPTQPVRLLIPQTPGGSTDILGRLLAQKLAEKWGQQVVVDNRGGANGIIGSDIAAKSAPNGYLLNTTLLEIDLKSGRTVKARVDWGKGSKADPMSMDEVAEKFQECASYAGWPGDKARRAIALVRGLGTVTSVRSITACLAS